MYHRHNHEENNIAEQKNKPIYGRRKNIFLYDVCRNENAIKNNESGFVLQKIQQKLFQHLYSFAVFKEAASIALKDLHLASKEYRYL